LKINKIAIVSKLGSKKAEKAVKGIATKLLKQKFKVYTISPVLVDGAKTVNSLEDLTLIFCLSTNDAVPFKCVI